MQTNPPTPPSLTPQTLAALRGHLARLDSTPFAAQAEKLSQELGNIASQVDQVAANQAAVAQIEEFNLVVEAVSEALPGMTSGILLAVEGFADGDKLSGVAGVMDSCASLSVLLGTAIGAGIGSLVPVAGTSAGAVVGAVIGSLIGAVFSLISDILNYFAPRTESLAETVQNLLRDQKAHEAQSDIRRVHYSFLVYAASLNDQCARLGSANGLDSPNFAPGVTRRVIDGLNFVEGNAMTSYWDVVDWLAGPENQSHRLWPLILNAVCSAYTVLLVAVVRLQSLVTSKAMFIRYNNELAKRSAGQENEVQELTELWNAATAKLMVYSVCNRINLRHLRQLAPVAQSWGTLWRITPGLQVSVMIPEVLSADLGGRSYRMSVTVGSKDQTAPEPPYQCYTIGDNSYVYYWRLQADAASKAKIQLQTTSANKFGPVDGEGDIFATPGTDLDKPNYSNVYTIVNNTIKGTQRADDSSVLPNGEFCSIESPGFKLKSVRAVHDPYSYADDPNHGSMKGIRYIVYAFAAAVDQPNQPIIYIFLDGQPSQDYKFPDLYNAMQLSTVSGIAVDQDYLWIFGRRAFACATHAALTRRAKGPMSFAPSCRVPWICREINPAIFGPEKSIQSLYPCDDGTLLLSVTNGSEVKMYSGSYRVDLKNGKITGCDRKSDIEWIELQGAAQHFEKLPVFCWPAFESLTETLEALQATFASDPGAGA